MPCRYTQATRQKPATPFLVDNAELGRRFRDRYVRGVRRLIKAGVLQIEDPAELITILDDVQACDWVVYIQPPPQETSDPADVLKYLARYMTGGPISDRRLIEVQRRSRVLLGAIQGQVGPSSSRVAADAGIRPELDAAHSSQGIYQGAALRRLEQHTTSSLPAAVRSLTTRSAVDDDRPARFSSAQFSKHRRTRVKKCPQCQTEMVLESHTRRPSWRELFYGPDHPRWMEWRGSG